MTRTSTPVADDAPHLLVVDDDRRIRDLLSRYLVDHGYRVSTAGSAAGSMASAAGVISFVPALALAGIKIVASIVGMSPAAKAQTGLEYRDMIQAGLDPKIARIGAPISGWIQTAIESDKVKGLVGYDALGKSLTGQLTKAIGEGILKGAYRQPIIKFFTRQAGRAIGEGLEEGLQQAVSSGVREAVRQQSETSLGKKLTPQTWKEVADEIINQTVQGALASIPLGILGEPFTVAKDVRSYNSWKATNKPAATAQPATKPAVTPPTVMPKGATVTAAQYDKYAATVAEPVPAGTHFQTKDYGDQFIHVAGDNKNKMVSSLTYEAAPSESETDTAPGKLTITAFAPGKNPAIDKALVLDLAKKYAGWDIEWEAMTPDAEALKLYLEKNNRRGTGVQWFSQPIDTPDVASLESTRAILQNARPNWNEQDIEDALFMSKPIAAAMGMTPGDLIGKSLAPQVLDPALIGENQQGTFGAAKQVNLDGLVKTIIDLAPTANPATFTHETVHAFMTFGQNNRAIPQIDAFMKEAESVFGVKDGNWKGEFNGWTADYKYPNRTAEEALAYGLEDYITTGKAPTPETEGFFKRMAKFLYDLYQSVKARVKLTPEITAFYNKLFNASPIQDTLKELNTPATDADNLTLKDATILHQGSGNTQETIYRDAMHQPSYKATISVYGADYGQPGKGYFALRGANDEMPEKKWPYESKNVANIIAEMEQEGWDVSVSEDGYGQPVLSVEHRTTRELAKKEEAALNAKWKDAKDVYVRYGKLPPGGKSKNYRDNIMEEGVSVFHGKLLPDGSTAIIPRHPQEIGTYSTLQNEPIYIIEGDEIGNGSDGEPLLTNAKQYKPKEYAKRIFPAQGTASDMVLNQGGAQDGWIYKAEEVISQKMQGPMPAQNILKMLQGAGVKADEMEWTGLDEFLATNEKKTPQEVKEFIAGNKLQIQEIQKGAPSLNTNSKYYIPEIQEAVKNAGDNPKELTLMIENDEPAHRALMEKFPELAENDNWGETVTKAVFGTETKETKFDKYVLPGGENYREVLFTLPEKRIDVEPSAYSGEGMTVSESNTFQSGHWSEPNVLAHTRLDDRTTTDGGKMLFIEEIQSDWGQEGRKKGFARSREERLSEFKDKGWMVEKVVKDPTKPSDDPNNKIYQAKLPYTYQTTRASETEEGAWEELLNARDQGVERGVPNMPFSKTWHEFVFKRVLREAAEKGYDSVGWTTGEQQAARYDLSKQVNAVNYRENKDGTYAMRVEGLNRETVLEGNYSPNELEGIIGKDVTQKIVNGDGEVSKTELSTGDVIEMKQLYGLDLKVGGEGMKGFYDKIIVDFANKYGKKWGAQVQDVDISAGRGYEGKSPYIQDKTETVHSLPITEAMRPAVMEGQTLFQGGTDSPAFREWFGDSAVKDEDGKPLVVYHGTTAEFEAFDPNKANPEADLGAGFYFTNNPDDVGNNYAGEGPDLKNKIDQYAEQLANETDREYDDPDVIKEAREKFLQHEGAVIPAFIKMGNPVIIGKDYRAGYEPVQETFLDYSQEYDEELDEYGEETGELVDFIVALRDIAEEYGVDPSSAISTLIEAGIDEGGLSAGIIITSLKNDENIQYAEDNEGRLVSSDIIRQAFERIGYDGFIDFTVDKKFGSQKRIGKPMEGMNPDTVHYIPFSPTQIKSVNNRGTWDANDARILYQGERIRDEVKAEAQRTIETGGNIEQFIEYMETPLMEDERIAWNIPDLSPEAKQAWYRKAWDEAISPAPETEPTIAEWVKGLAADNYAGIRKMLSAIWENVIQAMDARPEVGADPEEIQATLAAKDAAAEMRAEIAEPIIAGALAIGAGRNVSTRFLATLHGIIKANPEAYARIAGDTMGDAKLSAIGKKAEASKYGDIELPDVRMTISQKTALGKQLTDEKLSKAIISGEIVAGEEVSAYVKQLKTEAKAAAKQATKLEGEIKALEAEIDANGITIGKGRIERAQTQTELKKLVEKTDKLVNAGKEIPAELESRRKLIEKQLAATSAKLIAAQDWMEIERQMNKAQDASERADLAMNQDIARGKQVDPADLKEKFDNLHKAAELKTKLAVAKDYKNNAQLQTYLAKLEERTALQEKAKQQLASRKAAQEISTYKKQLKRQILRAPSKAMNIAYQQEIVKVQTDAEERGINKLTIKELESIATKIQFMRLIGNEIQKAKNAEYRNKVEEDQAIVSEPILENKNYEEPSGLDLTKPNRKSFMNRVKEAKYSAKNARRFIRDVLDGGKDGPNVQRLWYDKETVLRNQLLNEERRNKAINDAILAAGQNPEEWLSTSYTIPEAGPQRGEVKILKDDLMSLELAFRNEDSRQAILYGEFFSKNERDEHFGDQEWFDVEGEARFAKIMDAIDANLTDADMKILEAYEQDSTEAAPRLSKVMAEVYNLPFRIVDHYYGIIRKGATNKIDEQMQTEHNSRAILGKAPPRRGFTKERVTIKPWNQTPVKMGLLTTVSESIKRQEHLIAYAQYVKEVESTYRTPKMEEDITSIGGDAAVSYLYDYIDNMKNPQEMANRVKNDGLVRMLRGNVAFGALAFRTASMMTQITTSIWPAMQYSGPVRLVAEASKMMSNPVAYLRETEGMSVRLRARAKQGVNVMMEAIKTGKADTKFGKSIKKIEDIGMKGLEYVDRFSVAVAWRAMYDRYLADFDGDEQKAMEMADDKTMMTQPSAFSDDLAPMFQNKSGWAQIILQFQSSLNVIFQNIAYDMPAAVRAHDAAWFIGIAVSYSIAGILLKAVKTHPKDDETPEEKTRRLFFWSITQATDSIPIVGEIATGFTQRVITGEKAPSYPDNMFPGVQDFFNGLAQVTEGDMEKAGQSFLNSSVLLGMPVQMFRDIKRITEGDLGAIVGRPKQ